MTCDILRYLQLSCSDTSEVDTGAVTRPETERLTDGQNLQGVLQKNGRCFAPFFYSPFNTRNEIQLYSIAWDDLDQKTKLSR